MKGRGLYFPRIPAVKPSDIGILQRDDLNKKDIHEIKSQLNVSTKDYLEKAIAKYEGYEFVIPSIDLQN